MEWHQVDVMYCNNMEPWIFLNSQNKKILNIMYFVQNIFKLVNLLQNLQEKIL